tara:strand:- start:282 stop:413 length:132 start_codon:yes stop_codon:yes gene_type:complete
LSINSRNTEKIKVGKIENYYVKVIENSGATKGGRVDKDLRLAE